MAGLRFFNISLATKHGECDPQCECSLAEPLQGRKAVYRTFNRRGDSFARGQREMGHPSRLHCDYYKWDANGSWRFGVPHVPFCGDTAADSRMDLQRCSLTPTRPPSCSKTAGCAADYKGSQPRWRDAIHSAVSNRKKEDSHHIKTLWAATFLPSWKYCYTRFSTLRLRAMHLEFSE